MSAIEEDDEADKATLARILPSNSEVRALLDDPEKTLAYIRKVQATISDHDSALDSLVAVYEDRVQRLAKERAHAEAIAAQAQVAADKARRAVETYRRPRAEKTMFAKLQPHVWKIVYSTICVWGLVQLALTR